MRRILAGLLAAAAALSLGAPAPAADAKKADPKAPAGDAKKVDQKAPAPKPPEQKPDEIKMKDGTTVKGKITKIDAQGITYDAQGKTNTLKYEEFADFTLSDTPAALRDGRLAYTARNYMKAIEDFKTALVEVESNRARPLHKPAIYYQLALALEAGGDSAGSVDTLKKLIKELGDCRQRQDAFQLLLDIAQSRKDAASDTQLQELLGEMKNEPEPLRGQAEMVAAQGMYAKGNYNDALTIFTRLGGNAAQPYASVAKLWSLRCLRALKKTDELEKASKTVLANKGGSSPGLLQFASAILAENLVAKAEKDETLWREALFASAQAVALGPPPSREPADEYQSALLSAGRCYLALSEGKTAKPEVKKEYKDRAIAYYREVERFYKGTEAEKTAKKELSKLGVAEVQPKEGAKEPGKEAPKEPGKDAPKEPPKDAGKK